MGKINFLFKMAFTPSKCVWQPCPPVGLWEHLSEGKRKKREGGRGGEKEEEDRGCNRLSTLYVHDYSHSQTVAEEEEEGKASFVRVQRKAEPLVVDSSH